MSELRAEQAAAELPSRDILSDRERAKKTAADLLLAAARALDAGKGTAARDYLKSFPLTALRSFSAPHRHRTLETNLRSSPNGESPTLLAAIDAIRSAVANFAHVWNAYQALPDLEAELGAAEAAAIVATTLWDCVLSTGPALFKRVFDLFFRAGGDYCVSAYEQFLAEHANYVPGYYDFALLTKVSGKSASEFAGLANDIVRNTERSDLAPPLDVYLLQMRQAPAAEIVAGALALKSSSQRAAVADCMTYIGYTTEELRTVVAAFGDLTETSRARQSVNWFMQARLANADGSWAEAVRCAELAHSDSNYRNAADLLRAHALARMKNVDGARTVLDAVLTDADASHFDRARATFIRVTTELVRRGLPTPEERCVEIVAPAAGRPLAQSLWVGRKLRWIERLSIASYLRNGWRFQLYVYDEPDNVPEGCEVLDAAAIIPVKEVFRESGRSGLHAGSIGAFSDLFRYRLLFERGGLWTDTDVINFRLYEPDGRKFVCTEISDAGLVTLNGAIMAAPAGDAMMERAYERASALLGAKDKMFFTRVGPYLLAEMALEFGVDSYLNSCHSDFSVLFPG